MIFPLICSFSLSAILFFALCSYDFSFFKTYFNFLYSITSQANALYDQTLKINKFHLSSSEKVELADYKFFTPLIEDLLKFYRTFGVNIFDDLSNIRLALSQDAVQTQKIQTMLKGALAEIFLIILMSYAIILFSIHYAGLSFSAKDLGIIISLQISGISLLIFLMEKTHRHIFLKFYPYLKAVYSLQVFIKSRTALNEIAQRLELSLLEKDKDLNHIFERMEIVLKSLAEYGKVDSILLSDLINQTWGCFELKTQKFKSQVLKQKIFVIMSVIVPSYLYIFYALLKSLSL